MSRRFPLIYLVLVALWSALALAGTAPAHAALGAGDPLFPRSGDLRYDVAHYDVSVAYAPNTGGLRGAVRIEATALQQLSEFMLDLRHLEVDKVIVNGQGARFSHDRGKIQIFPVEALQASLPFTTTIRYHGRPYPAFEVGNLNGWLTTTDGAVGLGEPNGTTAWLPCNNALSDKATFDFHINVPADLKGISNGRLIGISREPRRKTFHWREAQPMDTYLAVIDIGRGTLTRTKAAGIPIWTFVDPAKERGWHGLLDELPEILRFETKAFGPYPFDAAGSIVDSFAFDTGLESQTRPIYDLPPLRTAVVHELAHQWFGDSVGLRRWSDIWLNEGFATWAQWFYRERHGGKPARQVFRELRHEPRSAHWLWSPPPGRPPRAGKLFAISVYLRGAMALEALRLKVGTPVMLQILREWASAHRYGNAETGEFIALAEQVSGRSLGALFDRWLFSGGKPG